MVKGCVVELSVFDLEMDVQVKIKSLRVYCLFLSILMLKILNLVRAAISLMECKAKFT